MSLFRKTISFIIVACLVLSSMSTAAVYAEDEITADTPIPDITALQEEVDEASAIYDEATLRVLDIEKDIEEITTRLEEIQGELPEIRELSNNAAREYYRNFSSSNLFLEMIFGATSFTDFFSKVEYSLRINETYLDNISGLSDLNTQLEDTRAELDRKKAILEVEQQRAEEALADAESARDEAERVAFLIAEASSAATAALAEELAAENHTPDTPAVPGVTTPETPAEKQAYVDLWAPRIDAYLAGSPLAGYGYAFASAAYDYNVDPRWSPAISCAESSKGRYCFYPYNAWGWDHTTWPDWETAIYAHVRGLSVGYGYTISEAAAKKYCANWQHWYSLVSSEMNRI